MNPPALRRYRAERLLRKEFSGLRSKVLTIVRSQLRAKGVTLDPSDLEACYAMAWHGLYATVLGGEEVENPSAWLVVVTFRRAIDEHRSASRSQVAADARWNFEHEVAGKRPRAPSDHDLAAELDNRARLRQVFEGLRVRLSERECEAASLCYLQGLSRAEAAGHMGISEARMRKLMEGAGPGRPGVAGKVGGLLDTIKSGGWCEQQSSLIRAFAFGVLDPGGERHALAMAHCRECPACRAHVASLRGLAAVLPLPLLSPLALTGAGAVATGVTGAGDSGAGATVAPSIARAGAGIGPGIARPAWSPLAGSLAAKLSVAALVVLGAGYVVLGSRAHGSPPAAHAAPASAPVTSEALARSPFPALSAPARPERSTRRSSTSRARSSRAPRSVVAAKVREFLPERLSREHVAPQLTSAPASAPSQSGSSRAAREFGIE